MIISGQANSSAYRAAKPTEGSLTKNNNLEFKERVGLHFIASMSR